MTRTSKVTLIVVPAVAADMVHIVDLPHKVAVTVSVFLQAIKRALCHRITEKDSNVASERENENENESETIVDQMSDYQTE